MLDQHVDRPDVDARQRVQLTGPNRSIALENSTSRSPFADTHSQMEARSDSAAAPLTSDLWHLTSETDI